MMNEKRQEKITTLKALADILGTDFQLSYYENPYQIEVKIGALIKRHPNDEMILLHNTLSKLQSIVCPDYQVLQAKCRALKAASDMFQKACGEKEDEISALKASVKEKEIAAFKAGREISSDCPVWNCEGHQYKYPTPEDYLKEKENE